jgi:hypothetical protein
MARVFAVMVQILWVLAVSRYKVNRWNGIYPGIVILLTALARSRYNAIEIYPGAGANAKTVTSKCPLLTVLGEVAVITMVINVDGFVIEQEPSQGI